MKKMFSNILCIIALIFFLSSPSSAQDNHHQHQVTNHLIEEMRTLDTVFRDVVSAVALGDTGGVHKALEPMHGTMEKTHEGMREGSVVIPKNANRIKEFTTMDREFHEKLESLDKAALRNDQKNMLLLTKELLNRCVQCHKMFRK